MSKSDDLNEFYENQEKPWWFWRCVHRDHAYWFDPDGKEYGCWRVLREAEGAVILHLECLSQVHVLVELAGTGSSCKTIADELCYHFDDGEWLKMIQDQFRDLKSIQRIPE